MTYDQLVVLIPSHSLEDFPSELGEKPAESLLNGFVILWHPLLLAEAQTLPRWQRADESFGRAPNRLVVVPLPSQDWAGGDAITLAREAGATVISGLSNREEMVAAALAPLRTLTLPELDLSANGAKGLSPSPEVDIDLVADFYALGHTYLQIELLTRHMRNFSHIDEVLMQREAVSAAKAAVAGDAEGARTHLRQCFEMLQTCRERFYPVDCFLIDLNLVTPAQAGPPLERLLASEQSSNLLLSGRDLDEIAREQPAIVEQLRQQTKAGKVDVVGGEWFENVTPLLGVDSMIWQLQKGMAAYQRHLGRRLGVWGRKRFGVSRQLPQLLHSQGFHAGLHFVMDDGLYPDEEQTRMRWEGLGGAVIDGFSRIPVAGDSASSFLRFPVRMAETMDQDHVAAICFARWPELRTPWLEDFRRAAKYAPVLGKFVTFSDFFCRGDQPGRMVHLLAEQYLTPFLVQRVARQEPDAISRYADWWERRGWFERGAWCQSVASLIRTGAAPDQSVIEETIELAAPDAEPVAVQAGVAAAQAMLAQGTADLAGLLQTGAKGTQPGWLLINPLSVSQVSVVELPGELEPPVVGGVVLAVQATGSESRKTSDADHDSRSGSRKTFAADRTESGSPETFGETLTSSATTAHRAVVNVPPCGFAWVASGASGTGGAPGAYASGSSRTLAEGFVLRNDLFEVVLSDVTGGIGQVRTPTRSPNRVSHQLAFRFPRERTIRTQNGDNVEETKSYYSEMRLREARVICEGPARGAIETTGDIVDQELNQVLATYRQVIEVWQGRPVIDLDIELELHRQPEGDPWSNYYGVRFAWKDAEAAQTRSWQWGAHPIGKQDRIESSHYIEIAKDNWRTTILPRGLTFHRRSGPRMIDSILICEGETRRRFQLSIAIDQQYPLHAAVQSLNPLICVPANGPLSFGATGWFFKVGASNVVLSRILPVECVACREECVVGKEKGVVDSLELEQSSHNSTHSTPHATHSSTHSSGCVLRLIETEGRPRTFPVQCFRTPKNARQRNLLGETVHSLRIEGDKVIVSVSPHEVCDVEITW